MAKRGLPRLTEAQFTAQVIRLAMLYGWQVCHFRPAKTARGWRTAIQGHVGAPDIIAARNGRVIGADNCFGTGMKPKKEYMWEAHKINIDVWIDDMPEMIVNHVDGLYIP